MSAQLRSAREILSAVTGVDHSTAQAEDRLAGLGLDSLDRVALAVRMEKATGMSLPDEVLRGLVSVGDVAQLLAGDRDDGPLEHAVIVERIGDDAATVHPTAEVAADAVVGPRTTIWHQAQVRGGTRIGADCVLGKGVYVAPGSVIGDRAKIQIGCGVFGARIEDEAMLAPGVYLLEDPAPRATNPDGTPKGWEDWDRVPVVVGRGATIGANAVVAPGVVVGQYAFVAIGSVVSRDVADHALVGGNPARQVGWVCCCGQALDESLRCPPCNRTYAPTARGLTSAT